MPSLRTIERASLLLLAMSCAPVRTGSPGQAGVAIPFELTNNLILVPTRINGSEPAWFILDTGASASVINKTLAERLRLNVAGETEVSTSGGSIGGSLVKDAEVSLPRKELGALSLLAIPLAGVEAGLGRAVGGILGADLFDRFVVEIDYANRTIQLHDPEAYRYSGPARPLPITFEDHTPFIRAVVVDSNAIPVEGNLLIDTGANGALTLNSPFVKRNRLVETSQRVIAITSGAILAGKAKTYVGRLGGLRLGTVSIQQPIANFSQDTVGDEASASNDGFIGGEVLRRFKLITDYAHARIILESTDRVSEPFEFDMSGISFAAEGMNFERVQVRLVLPDSPAAEAGVMAGDILTSIDGMPANTLGLDKIRRMLRTADKEYRLALRRGDASLDAEIRTRRLV